MKQTIFTTQLVFALLVAPAFAGNDKKNDKNNDDSNERQSSYTYLALGDSLAFGFNPLLVPPFSTRTPSPAEFIGYPEVVAAIEHLSDSGKEVNSSCPGETSGSFLDTSSPDNGCNSPHIDPSGVVGLPFKTGIGLHTRYTGAQMAFADLQFKTNKHIDLVTLSIGANDILLVLPALAACTDSACADRVLAPVFQSYWLHLYQILSGIRGQYQGTLILVNYYAPSPALEGLTVALNNLMTDVVAQLALQHPNYAPIKFADSFTAFQFASALFNHDACRAGLLIPYPSPSTECDIHPSKLGREWVAAAVELAKRARN